MSSFPCPCPSVPWFGAANCAVLNATNTGTDNVNFTSSSSSASLMMCACTDGWQLNGDLRINSACTDNIKGLNIVSIAAAISFVALSCFAAYKLFGLLSFTQPSFFRARASSVIALSSSSSSSSSPPLSVDALHNRRRLIFGCCCVFASGLLFTAWCVMRIVTSQRIGADFLISMIYVLGNIAFWLAFALFMSVWFRVQETAAKVAFVQPELSKSVNPSSLNNTSALSPSSLFTTTSSSSRSSLMRLKLIVFYYGRCQVCVLCSQSLALLSVVIPTLIDQPSSTLLNIFRYTYFIVSVSSVSLTIIIITVGLTLILRIVTPLTSITSPPTLVTPSLDTHKRKLLTVTGTPATTGTTKVPIAARVIAFECEEKKCDEEGEREGEGEGEGKACLLNGGGHVISITPNTEPASACASASASVPIAVPISPLLALPVKAPSNNNKLAPPLFRPSFSTPSSSSSPSPSPSPSSPSPSPQKRKTPKQKSDEQRKQLAKRIHMFRFMVMQVGAGSVFGLLLFVVSPAFVPFYPYIHGIGWVFGALVQVAMLHILKESNDKDKEGEDNYNDNNDNDNDAKSIMKDAPSIRSAANTIRTPIFKTRNKNNNNNNNNHNNNNNINNINNNGNNTNNIALFDVVDEEEDGINKDLLINQVRSNNENGKKNQTKTKSPLKYIKQLEP